MFVREEITAVRREQMIPAAWLRLLSSYAVVDLSTWKSLERLRETRVSGVEYRGKVRGAPAEYSASRDPSTVKWEEKDLIGNSTENPCCTYD